MGPSREFYGIGTEGSESLGVRHWGGLQEWPTRVGSYFKHPMIAYATV